MAKQLPVTVSQFIDEIRTITGDDEELRSSLQKFGWVPDLPALVDEDGEVIVGHRRTRLAKELGIPAVRKTIVFGEGDAADAERLKLAIVSNIGGQPMSKKDRKRIAEHLYGKGTWSMDRIGEALGVSKMQISRDLSDCNITLQSKPAKTASNPKGSGRSKGSGEPKDKPKRTKFDEAREIVRSLVEADEPLRTRELEKEHGISVDSFERAAAAERARKEALEEVHVDPATLSASAQAKLEIVIRQLTRKHEAEFEQRVSEACQRGIEQTVLPHYNDTYAIYQDLIKARGGIMSKATFNKIRRCLHPDSRNSVSDEMLREAWNLFSLLEKRLLDEKESPTPTIKMPSTYDEMMAMKRKTSAARRAKKEGAVQVT